MSRLKNIATIILLTAIMLLAGHNYVHAQNDATNPYIDSWHQYSVVMGTGTGYSWDVFTSAADATNNTGAMVGLTVVTNDDGSIATIEVLFDNGIFSAGTYYLVYSEFTGSTCTARRSIEINVVANQFYLDEPATSSGCNSNSGLVWDNAIANLSTPSTTCSVNFTVTMNSPDALFNIDGWSFNGSISFVGVTTYSLVAPSAFPSVTGATANGNWTMSDISGGDFLMTINNIPDNYNGATDEVTFTVEVVGDVTEDVVIRLEISNGKAFSGDGSTYVVETSDNLTDGNRRHDKTIWGVPNTSVISVVP